MEGGGWMAAWSYTRELSLGATELRNKVRRSGEYEEWCGGLTRSELGNERW